MPGQSDPHWHHLDVQDITAQLGSDARDGLENGAVAEIRERHGANVLSRREGHGPLVRFLMQFHAPLVYILLIATLVMALLAEWIDASVIFGVVLINSIIGYIQEAKAVTAIEALTRSLSNKATVIRQGRKWFIPASELVPGDIVLLQPGDKVPADLRLLETTDLQIDESCLTGESVPVEKSTAILTEDTSLADRSNMAYSSTLVTYGTGRGIVIATGDATQIGRISEMISAVEVLDTPLTRKIKSFSMLLMYVILGLALLTYCIGMLRGMPWFDTFLAAVALAVGAIPEGLPATVTIMLAIGVNRMASRQAIIRNLPAVETLGSTTVICSDKTGTLTCNQMTVKRLLAGEMLYAIDGVGYQPAGSICRHGDPDSPGPGMLNAAARECLLAGLLCNDAEVERDETSRQWTVQGDPTEGALIVSALKSGLDRKALARSHPRLHTIPFASQNQFMASLHALGDGEHANRMVYLKGSLESLLPRCEKALDNEGKQTRLNAEDIERISENLAAEGLRILVFAGKRFPSGYDALRHEDVSDGLIFLGLQAMIDPPREEAVRAVATCHRAGIRVKMITGDHAITATAIARQLGIIGADEGPEAVLSGRQLDALSDEEITRMVRDRDVFARVSPERKLRLVQALQAEGQIVAMTGDGVNDAPALRQADIGVAMAMGGTEVAREASDMILTDDNFASIEAAIEEGRAVYDNLLKFIGWTLPTNGGEGLVLMLAILLGIALPILPVQILWINMTTAILLGLMLAFEPKEKDIMQRRPRDPAVPILTPGLIGRIIMVSALLCAGAFGLFTWELREGSSENYARTVACAVFVFGELFYLFACRSLDKPMWALGLFSNRWIWLGAGGMALLQVLFTYLPIMNRLFYSEPIDMAAWLRILAVSMSIYLVAETEKWIQRLRVRSTR